MGLRIEVPKGQGVVAYIGRAAQAANITDAQVSVHGALQSGVISTMDVSGRDHSYKFDIPMEIEGNGDLRDGQLHIHMTLGSRLFAASRCGHFIDGIAYDRFTVILQPVEDASTEALLP